MSVFTQIVEIKKQNKHIPKMDFHNILQNVDILIYIYKRLNIEDQFRLAQVNSELKNLFERYIFPQQNYSTLKIIGNGKNVVVTNESNRNRIVLKPAEFQEFIHYHGKDVKMLEKLRGTVLDDLRPMQNLTAIRYCFTTIHIKYFEELEKMCPQLELLHVNICIDENGRQIMLGRNLDVKSLLPLKKLKSLSMVQYYGPDFICTISYEDFIELVTELNLEYLSLDECIVYYYMSESTPNVLVNPVHLKELNIGLNCYPGSGISPYITIFKNLVTLVLTIYEVTISDMLLRNIADACLNLNVLHIRYSDFEIIHSFSIPSKVKELSLTNCYSLTTKNLRQILTSPGLTKFYSQDNDYEGEEIEDFAISPSLQTLHINDYSYSCKVAFGGSPNLKYLSWEFSSFPYNDAGLQKSTNLEELDLRWQNLSPTTLSKLNLLRKLTITMSELPASCCNFKAIMQHSPLSEVVLKKRGKKESPRNTTDLLGFPTNVRILRIDQEIFDMALHFWLDLVAQNEELHLEINEFKEKRKELMQTLLTHEKFPKNRKALDICGFTVKCSDLKRNFDATMDKLMKANTKDLNRVIFLRN